MKKRYERIKSEYKAWRDFMREQVSFYMGDYGYAHGLKHCAHVLLFSLLIADAKGLSRSQRDTLATAAVFHDSQRQSDWGDRDHGRRSAEYYKRFCEHADMDFDPIAYEIIAWHDRRTAHGISVIEENHPERTDAPLLYKIFKDADALDRARFGEGSVDLGRLRTPEALGLYPYAIELASTY